MHFLIDVYANFKTLKFMEIYEMSFRNVSCVSYFFQRRERHLGFSGYAHGSEYKKQIALFLGKFYYYHFHDTPQQTNHLNARVLSDQRLNIPSVELGVDA